jgi:hypothetical protein
MMPSLFSRLFTLVVVLLLGAEGAHGQESAVSLKLRWMPGYVYTQETVTETHTGLKAVGQPADQKLKAKQTTRIEVESVPNGNKKARVIFAALSGEVETPNGKQVFDSADLSKASPEIRASVGQSVGKQFVLVYDENDAFVGIEETGAMVSGAMISPSLENIAEAKEVAELFRHSLEMGLPDKPVKPGERWVKEETVKFPSAGAIRTRLRGRLETLLNYDGRRHAKLSFEGDLIGDPAAGKARLATLAKGSKISGQVLFDLERGTVSASAHGAYLLLDIQGRQIPVRQQVTSQLVKLEKRGAEKPE